MDLFDFVPAAPGPEPPRGRNRRESVAGGVVVLGIPLVHVALLTVTDLSKRPDLAMLWLPVLFSLAGTFVCVAARVSLGRSLMAVLGCLWWCLLGGTALVVIDIVIFPF